MSKTLFSIIVVSLNPGEKLFETLDSIKTQTFADYEVVIKDGGSKDGSIGRLRAYLEKEEAFAKHIRLYETPDKSIYDGMNQAVAYAEGEYLYFLNCGDTFYGNEVLAEVAQAIGEQVDDKLDVSVRAADSADGDATTISGKTGEDASGTPAADGQTSSAGQGSTQATTPHVYYGNIYDMLQQEVVASNPHIDAFACYRNVPCHQACFYQAALFAKRGYKTRYKVRGDYEHFLWCFFEAKAVPVYVPTVIANYEGGGYSETKENLKRSQREHKEITSLYMSKGQLLKYKMILLLTLAPLRTWMSHNKAFSGLYNRLKRVLYRNR